MSSKIITLTTDFGTRDGYVGAMKGVILGIDPEAKIVDISHDIPPQDGAHGAFVLGSAHRYFPPDSVHLAVVDPGVGTPRKALAVVTGSDIFVGPDNGLLSYVLQSFQDRSGSKPFTSADAGLLQPVTGPVPEGCSAYELTRSEYWMQPVSDTFHGRDVFAPVAANLSLGVPPEKLGDPVHELVWLNLPHPVVAGGRVEGRIIHVDRYGNLVSNIPGSDLPAGNAAVEIGGRVIEGISRSYAEGSGELVAIIGSHSYLEVARPNGDAARLLEAGIGDEVRVRPAG